MLPAQLVSPARLVFMHATDPVVPPRAGRIKFAPSPDASGQMLLVRDATRLCIFENP